MPAEIHVPIFSDLAPGGFKHGANYLVEFDSNSIWYETSLTILARALRAGVKSHYHTFMHIPGEVRRDLQKLVPSLKRLEEEDRFRLIDSYTNLTGLPIQPETGSLSARHKTATPNDPSYLETFTATVADLLKEGAPESDKRWLHIDDNTSIFNRYFKEQDVLNIFQTRTFQLTRILELSMFHSVVSGVFSDAFYRQFETQCDGVIDFKTEENDGQLETLVRVRSLRGRSCDSRWRHLQLASNEVTLGDRREDTGKEIGMSGWLKGPKKK